MKKTLNVMLGVVLLGGLLMVGSPAVAQDEVGGRSGIATGAGRR